MPVLVQLSGLKLRALHRTRAQGLDGDAMSDGSSYGTLAKHLAPCRRRVGMATVAFHACSVLRVSGGLQIAVASGSLRAESCLS